MKTSEKGSGAGHSPKKALESIGGAKNAPVGASQTFAEQVPEARRALFLKARRGEASPRQAIKAHCQQCVGYENTVLNIRECDSKTCPLWMYRPYRSVQ